MRKTAKVLGFATAAGVISSAGLVAANASQGSQQEPAASSSSETITFISPEGEQTRIDGLNDPQLESAPQVLESNGVSPSNLDIQLTPETPGEPLTPETPGDVLTPETPGDVMTPASPVSAVSPTSVASPVTP